MYIICYEICTFTNKPLVCILISLLILGLPDNTASRQTLPSKNRLLFCQYGMPKYAALIIILMVMYPVIQNKTNNDRILKKFESYCWCWNNNTFPDLTEIFHSVYFYLVCVNYCLADMAALRVEPKHQIVCSLQFRCQVDWLCCFVCFIPFVFSQWMTQTKLILQHLQQKVQLTLQRQQKDKNIH